MQSVSYHPLYYIILMLVQVKWHLKISIMPCMVLNNTSAIWDIFKHSSSRNQRSGIQLTIPIWCCIWKGIFFISCNKHRLKNTGPSYHWHQHNMVKTLTFQLHYLFWAVQFLQEFRCALGRRVSKLIKNVIPFVRSNRSSSFYLENLMSFKSISGIIGAVDYSWGGV